MSFNNWFKKQTTINFTVKNLSAKRLIHIFGAPINPGGTRDLLSLPEISESDIRHSLIKGELANFIRMGIVSIVSSSIDLQQFDGGQQAFLENAGAFVSEQNYLIQPLWYIDPSNSTGKANDANDGYTSLTPLLSKKELMRRIGAQNGPINIDMNVYFISEELDARDTTALDVDCSKYLLTYTMTMITLATGTLTAAKARVQNNLESGLQTITNGSASSANYWTQYIGNMIFDSTANAIAWVYKDSGAKTAITSQFANYIPFSTLYGSYGAPEIDPGNTDHYTIKRPGKIYTTKVSTHGGMCQMEGFDFQSVYLGIGIVSGVYSTQFIGNIIVFQNCAFNTITDATLAYTYISNCYIGVGGYYTNTSIFTGSFSQGIISTDANIFGQFLLSGNVLIDANIYSIRILNGSTIESAYLSNIYTIGSLGNGPAEVSFNSYTYLGMWKIWGPGGLAIQDGSSITYFTQMVGNLLCATFTLDGATTATTFDPAASPPVFVTARTITAAHLDASVATGGFGGLAIGNKMGKIALGS